jgi:phosphohistidine phosphatase SixA
LLRPLAGLYLTDDRAARCIRRRACDAGPDKEQTIMLSRPGFGLCFFALLVLLQQAAVAADNAVEDAIWSALKSGRYVVLIRHAVTEPGVGDPPGFTHGQCSTQRNLSEQGRIDARRIGAAFQARDIPVAGVLSSRWCRCLDTAKLAFGKVTPTSMLDSMFNDPDKPAAEKIREVFAAAARRSTAGNLVMVTHNQNIHALTGVSTMSGEMVVVLPENGKFKIIGQLPVPRE